MRVWGVHTDTISTWNGTSSISSRAHVCVCVRMSRRTYETPRSYCLILDLADGGALFDRVVQKGALSEAEASNYILQVAEALLHVHRRNIMHGAGSLRQHVHVPCPMSHVPCPKSQVPWSGELQIRFFLCPTCMRKMCVRSCVLCPPRVLLLQCLFCKVGINRSHGTHVIYS